MAQLDRPSSSDPVPPDDRAGGRTGEVTHPPGGPGAAAPLMASNDRPGSLLTLPLRTAAGALRLTADFMSGLARRVDDRRH